MQMVDDQLLDTWIEETTREIAIESSAVATLPNLDLPPLGDYNLDLMVVPRSLLTCQPRRDIKTPASS